MPSLFILSCQFVVFVFGMFEVALVCIVLTLFLTASATSIECIVIFIIILVIIMPGIVEQQLVYYNVLCGRNGSMWQSSCRTRRRSAANDGQFHLNTSRWFPSLEVYKSVCI